MIERTSPNPSIKKIIGKANEYLHIFDSKKSKKLKNIQRDKRPISIRASQSGALKRKWYPI